MFGRAVQTVDRLPLAGKYVLEPALKGYIRSGPEKEWRKFVGLNALLGMYIVGHAALAKFGADTFAEHMRNLESTGNMDDGLFMAIDGTYATLNAAMTLRQASLVKRANDIRKWRARRRDRIQATSVPSKPVIEPAIEEAVALQEASASEPTERLLKKSGSRQS